VAARRDILRDRLSRDELVANLARAGWTAHDVLSTRSRPYKELGLKDGEISEDELLDLMVEHPALIRRPLVIADRGAVVGFNRAGLTDLLDTSHDGG
jgi:arsenate reductase-like glutaredoxin family protein